MYIKHLVCVFKANVIKIQLIEKAYKYLHNLGKISFNLTLIGNIQCRGELWMVKKEILTTICM